jgi:predicted DNA-binding transcriptional regulator AlpA
MNGARQTAEPVVNGNPTSSGTGLPRRGSLLNVKQVATKLSVPESWVRKHGDSLPGVVRLGKYVRWTETELDQFIADGGLS